MNGRVLKIAVFAALSALALPASAQTVGGSNGAPVLLFAKLIVNGISAGTQLVARDGRSFFMRPETLRKLRLERADFVTFRIDGETFVPLPATQGIAPRFDEARQELELTVDSTHFSESRIRATPQGVQPTSSTFSAFLNYDLNLQYDDTVVSAGYIEAGMSDDWGFAAGSATVTQSAGHVRATRLETYFLRDDPDRLRRLVVGDTITSSAGWSQQIRYGGIRIGTEFALRPDLVTFPTPVFGGRTAIPSQIELLVNGALRYRTSVDRGPFSLEQVPLVTGHGEVTLVTRDLLGVERSVTSSYYVSPSLLRTDLTAWSFEAGFARRDYGISNFSYDDPFGAATLRKGITNRMTLEGRAEVSGDLQMAGAGTNLVLPSVGEFGVAGALSRGVAGEGWLSRVSFRRISRGWSVAASYQHASAEFYTLGGSDVPERITEQIQASTGMSFGSAGNVSLSYTDLAYSNEERVRLGSANYNLRFGSRGNFSAYAIMSDSREFGSETKFGVSLALSLGPRASMYVRGDSEGLRGEVRRTADYDGGFGYRLAASMGKVDRQQAELDWRGDAAEARLEAARFDGDTGFRAQVGGALLLAGERVFATRRIENGLAVVEVPGMPDVRVYQDNRLVTRTDELGRAVVPNLRPYEENLISIAPGDIPMEASMPYATLTVVPTFRGAAKARFSVAQRNPVIVAIEQPDGTPVEAGSTVRFEDGSATFAGFGGEVYIGEARAGMVVEADTARGPCRIVLAADQEFGGLPRLGPFRCRLDGESP